CSHLPSIPFLDSSFGGADLNSGLLRSPLKDNSDGLKIALLRRDVQNIVRESGPQVLREFARNVLVTPNEIGAECAVVFEWPKPMDAIFTRKIPLDLGKFLLSLEVAALHDISRRSLVLVVSIQWYVGDVH